MVRVEVVGADEAAEWLLKIPGRLLDEFHRRVGARQEEYLNGLRSSIQVVVYNAYQPTEGGYERNFKLWLAANKELLRPPNGVEFTLFNDTARVAPTSPKGGSQPQDVPFEIEEGRWPTQWYGFTARRPAYTLYAEGVMKPEMDRVADAALDAVLS